MAELCKLDGNTQFKQRNWEASAVSPTSFGHQAQSADLAMALLVWSLASLAALPQHTRMSSAVALAAACQYLAAHRALAAELTWTGPGQAAHSGAQLEPSSLHHAFALQIN